MSKFPLSRHKDPHTNSYIYVSLYFECVAFGVAALQCEYYKQNEVVKQFMCTRPNEGIVWQLLRIKSVTKYKTCVNQ